MFKAVGKTIIIEPVFEKKLGLIFIPDSPGYKQLQGKIYGIVQAIGERSMWKEELKERDWIYFVRNEGIRFYYQGKMYLKLKDRWVLGVVND